MNEPAVLMTSEERRRDAFAEALCFRSPDGKTGWSIDEIVNSRGLPASEVRRHLGYLYGQGRAVSFVDGETIRWRSATCKEMLGL